MNTPMPVEEPEEFPVLLRSYVERALLMYGYRSHEQIAWAAGINKGTLSHLQKGEKNASSRVLMDLGLALHLDRTEMRKLIIAHFYWSYGTGRSA